MSFKKNLTVAGLAVLMAVPALGATHIDNAHIPIITAIKAHASQTGGYWGNNYVRRTNLPSSYWGKWHASYDYGPRSAGNGKSVHSPINITIRPHDTYFNIRDGNNRDDNSRMITTTNGSQTYNSDSYLGWAWAHDNPIGKTQPTGIGLTSNGNLRFNADTTEWILHRVNDKYSNHSNSLNGSVNPTSSLNNSNSNSTFHSANDSSQHISKNSLPRTGEVNNQVNRLVASILLSATGAGLGAMTMKKHKKDKNMAKAAPIQAESFGGNNGNSLNNIVNTLADETNELNNCVDQITNK